MADIGVTLFVNLLGMTMYPGSPFTGNVYRDIIMFLIVPTIFIIMVLYIMSGRIIPDKKLRIMLGVGAYLFIVAGGYYSFFALLAGPYFIFLIFILGVLGYLLGHFRRGGQGGAYSRGGGGGYSKSHGRGMTTMGRIGYLDSEIKKLKKEYDAAKRGNLDRTAQDIRQEIRQLEEEMEDEESRFNPSKRKKHDD